MNERKRKPKIIIEQEESHYIKVYFQIELYAFDRILGISISEGCASEKIEFYDRQLEAIYKKTISAGNPNLMRDLQNPMCEILVCVEHP